MTLAIGFTPQGEFYLSAEARIQMPHGLETLRWTTLFESEAPFLYLAVSSSLAEQDLALILTEVIRAIAETPEEGCCRTFEIELNAEQFYALGLGDGVCMAYGPETALQP